MERSLQYEEELYSGRSRQLLEFSQSTTSFQVGQTHGFLHHLGYLEGTEYLLQTLYLEEVIHCFASSMLHTL